MTPLAQLIDRSTEEWNADLEMSLFGTSDATAIAELLASFCSRHLAEPVDALLYRPGVGVVVALELVDGRKVAIKVHRWNASVERLTAVQSVQRHLYDHGVPAPLPLLAPTPLGSGVATAEEYLPGEDRVDGRDPAVRRTIAGGLFAFVAACRPLGRHVDVGTPPFVRPAGTPLWPEPHDLRFDFDATSGGAEWIDELATLARSRLAFDADDNVVGHFDWRVENLGFAGTSICGIYDWDSVAAAPEPVVVGTNAGQFCTDWGTRDADSLPTLAEMEAFVEDYERARGEAFDRAQRRLLDAANLALVAYGARCQHSDATFHPELGGTSDNRWMRLLRERGENGLAHG